MILLFIFNPQQDQDLLYVNQQKDLKFQNVMEDFYNKARIVIAKDAVGHLNYQTVYLQFVYLMMISVIEMMKLTLT